MKANFIDRENGETYFITGYRIVSKNNRTYYCDKDGNEFINKDGNPLLPTNTDENLKADHHIISAISIGYGTEARNRDMKGIREIATRHAKSDDGRHTRLKNTRKELNGK